MNGPHRVSSAAQASWSSSRRLGDPVADRPVADLVVVLAADHQPPRRHGRGVDRHAVVAAAERAVGAVVEEAALAHLGQRAERLEVGVVAGGLAGERHVHRVVEVVAPLGVQSEAAGLARGDQARVVEVGLRDQRQRPALVRRHRGHLDRHLLEQVQLGLVVQRVHGVQPQPVDVVVGEPHPHVVEDQPAHLGRALAVEVHQVAPGVAALLEVGAELRQVVAGRSEVVVDDVLDDAEPGRVAAVDEPLVAVGAAVRLVHGRPQHAVVAPVVGAVDGVDRHHLDEVDADRAQVVQAPERRVEGALRGEGADVELVDHRARQLATGPAVVGPGDEPRAGGFASVGGRPPAGAATAGRVGARPCRRSGSRSRRLPSPGPGWAPTGSTNRRRSAASPPWHRATDSRSRCARGAQTSKGPRSGHVSPPGRGARRGGCRGASSAPGRPGGR